MKINWKQKLTSRKFWAAVSGVAISVMLIFGAKAEMQEKVTGAITATGTLAVYILSEGSVDKAAARKDDNEVK